MKHFFLSLILSIIGNSTFGQNSPKEITPEILKNIKAEVEAQIPKLKQELSKQDLNADAIEFKIDTFRIETIASKRMEIDYTTAGMVVTVDELTASYDKLMNKYYGKLLKLLKPDDKKILVTAQKAWLVFRDAELKLIGTMTDEQYSGGGTMQSNIRSAQYSSVLVKRTIDIFIHYDGILKDE